MTNFGSILWIHWYPAFLRQEYLESGSPMAGWGVGLALGRLYARWGNVMAHHDIEIHFGTTAWAMTYPPIFIHFKNDEAIRPHDFNKFNGLPQRLL